MQARQPGGTSQGAVLPEGNGKEMRPLVQGQRSVRRGGPALSGCIREGGHAHRDTRGKHPRRNLSGGASPRRPRSSPLAQRTAVVDRLHRASPGWQKERVRVSLHTADVVEARRRRDDLLSRYPEERGCALSLRIGGARRARGASRRAHAFARRGLSRGGQGIARRAGVRRVASRTQRRPMKSRLSGPSCHRLRMEARRNAGLFTHAPPRRTRCWRPWSASSRQTSWVHSQTFPAMS